MPSKTAPILLCRVKRQLAFTLVEVLVALLVAAIVSVMSFRGIDALIMAETRLEEHSTQWVAVHRFFNTLETDLRLALPRPGRDAGGTSQPAMVGLAAPGVPFGAQLALMQSSASANPPIRRIAYRFSEGRIELLRWTSADLSPYGEPHVLLVLEGVRHFSIRYQGIDTVWRDVWQPNNPIELPRGFEVQLEMSDPLFGGRIDRVVSR